MAASRSFSETTPANRPAASSTGMEFDVAAEEEVGRPADRIVFLEEGVQGAHHVAGDDAAEERFAAPRIGQLQFVGVGERFVADHAVPPRLLGAEQGLVGHIDQLLGGGGVRVSLGGAETGR